MSVATSNLKTVANTVAYSAANLISVAVTTAPCLARASTLARPMPWPAAVTTAVLFFSLSMAFQWIELD